MTIKYLSTAILTLCSALTATAVSVTVGNTSTDWAGTDFKTISDPSTISATFFDLKQNSTAGIVQSFTATTTMNVGTISIQTLRLNAGLDFGLDVYQLYNGDGTTPGANPSQFLLGNTNYSVLLKSFTLNSSTSITSGTTGMLNVILNTGEQFQTVAGSAYAIHIYSKVVSGDSTRILTWNYSNSDSYSGGTYGAPSTNVVARDLSLALTAAAIPEPSTITLILGALAGGIVLIGRRPRR